MPRPQPRVSPRSIAFLLACALVSVALLAPRTAEAQYFGRNKVQWEKFDWKVLKTEHFDIYYYADEKAITDAGQMAERWYGRLSEVFGFDLAERRSIVLYADASDFQQTTVVGSLIGEGTGGLTEPLRTRVVMPLTGRYEDTDHVLGHELVHVFQFEILLGPSRGQQTSQRSSVNLPLWFIEGLAEYLSLGRQDPLTAMWLRDALLRDELPDLRDLSRDPSLFPYRWGHAFWAYVGGRWGDRTVADLFTAGTQLGVESAVESLLGLKSEDFSQQWKNAISQTYGTVLEARTSPRSLGRVVLPRQGEEARDVNIAPELSPDGTQFVFLSTRSLFTFDLYLADARTGEIKRKLLSNDANPHFDALRFIDSSGTWSPDGRRFAFVVLSQGDSRLAVLDLESRDIVRRYDTEELGDINNPAWSPDGRSIAFSGASGGVSDLYLIDVESGTLRRLTNDLYAEVHPAWSPDGRTLAFASDRREGTSLEQLTYAPMEIRLLDLASGQQRSVAPFPGSKHIDPHFSPDGRDLYFISDRGGVSDVYRHTLASGETFQVTRVGTGVSGITELSPALSVAERTGEIMFSTFFDTDYLIHALDSQTARGERVPAAEVASAAVLPPVETRAQGIVAQYLSRALPALPRERSFTTDEYDPKLSLEYVGPVAGVGFSTFGTTFAGSLSAQFGDVLGERTVGVILQGQGGELSEFGGQAYYLNQEQRWNWGAAVGRIPYITARTSVRPTVVEIDGQEVQGRLIQQIRETVTETGGSLISQYPFSTTRRFELAAGYTRLSFERELFELVAVGNTIIDEADRGLAAPESLDLYQGSAALVGDSSYFGFTSPVRGQRWRLEVEPTFGSLEFQSLLADYRRYFFMRPVTFAVRGLHYGRYGTDAESERLSELYVGYPTLVRGYEIGDIDIDECTPVPGDPQACPEFDRLVGSRLAIANLELRVPLLGTEGFGLIELPFLPTELSAFVDAGVAWTKDLSPELRFEERSTERVPVVSAGLSARVLLGGFAVLEFYYAKPFQRPNEDWVTGFLISPGW